MSFAPLSVFEVANQHVHGAGYDLEVFSQCGGFLSSSFGMNLETKPLLHGLGLDTLLVGPADKLVRPSPEFCALLYRVSKTARRIGSISTGAYPLAAAGLLDGRQATTLSAHAADLSVRYPSVRLQADRVFISDGPVWTSAGLTASIDMALGMVEKDFGNDVAINTARTLGLQRRQAEVKSSQSTLVDLTPKSDRVQRALAYASKNLREGLSVAALADAAFLSPRQFSRVFRAETGKSPAKAIEMMRLESARFRLVQSRVSIEEIAVETGFRDRDRMRRAFVRAYGLTPQQIRAGAQQFSHY